MALNTLKCNHMTPLHFKGLNPWQRALDAQQPGLELWLHLSAADADAGGVCTERHWPDGSQLVNECTVYTTPGN